MGQFGGIKETIGRFYFAQTMKKKSNSCTFKIVITYAFWKSKCQKVPPSPLDLFRGSATMPSLVYPKHNPKRLLSDNDIRLFPPLSRDRTPELLEFAFLLSLTYLCLKTQLAYQLFLYWKSS